MNEATLQLFDNLPNIVRVSVIAPILGLSIKTLYDWNYRRKMRRIPDDLFIKINSVLYIKTEVLRKWITCQQNPSK